jgi:hypothetical protein
MDLLEGTERENFYNKRQKKKKKESVVFAGTIPSSPTVLIVFHRCYNST